MTIVVIVVANTPVPDVVVTAIPTCRLAGIVTEDAVTVMPDEMQPAIITLGRVISSKNF